MNESPNRPALALVVLLSLAVAGSLYLYHEHLQQQSDSFPPHAGCKDGECVGLCCQIPVSENGKLVTKHAPWCQCTRRCRHCR